MISEKGGENIWDDYNMISSLIRQISKERKFFKLRIKCIKANEF